MRDLTLDERRVAAHKRRRTHRIGFHWPATGDCSATAVDVHDKEGSFGLWVSTSVVRERKINADEPHGFVAARRRVQLMLPCSSAVLYTECCCCDKWREQYGHLDRK